MINIFSKSKLAPELVLHSELMRIIRGENIDCLFQPIVCLKTGKTFAYEALSRTEDNSIFDTPQELFNNAQRFRLSCKLESVCRKKAISKLTELGIENFVSINLCPSFLKGLCNDSKLTRKFIDDIYHLRTKLIFELTERINIEDYKTIINILNLLKKNGFKIAIDNYGSGFLSLKMISEIAPFMVKIDKSLIKKIDSTPKKQRLLKAIISYCHSINTLVAAECIETKEELEVLCMMKLDYGQGFFLAKPGNKIIACSNKGIEIIQALNSQTFSNQTSDNFIGALNQYVEPISQDEIVYNVVKRFKSTLNLMAIPIISSSSPVGIIHKTKLFFTLGQRFGYDLYIKRSVKNVLETATVFEADTPIEEVSKYVINRDENTIYDAIIITKNGAYIGMVKVHHILEHITEQKIKLATQSNPLTGLPGNNLIEEAIESRLNVNQEFAVMYFDLDHFKPFNDSFGFEQGDKIIRFTAKVIKDCVDEWDSRGFVGHVGGDDFVAVCRAQGIEELCMNIVDQFDKGVARFHDEETIEKGFYKSISRSGEVKEFPPVSISIAVVSTIYRAFKSFGHIASVASEVKKKAKGIKGSSYYIDQRQEVS